MQELQYRKDQFSRCVFGLAEDVPWRFRSRVPCDMYTVNRSRLSTWSLSTRLERKEDQSAQGAERLPAVGCEPEKRMSTQVGTSIFPVQLVHGEADRQRLRRTLQEDIESGVHCVFHVWYPGTVKVSDDSLGRSRCALCWKTRRRLCESDAGTKLERLEDSSSVDGLPPRRSAREVDHTFFVLLLQLSTCLRFIQSVSG